MKYFLIFVALLSLLGIQPAVATPTPKTQLNIKSLGLKHYKSYGRPEKCVILSVHNQGTKAVLFPIDNLKSNMVSEPNYTYEIKAKNQIEWAPFTLSLGSYLAPKIFRTVGPKQVSKICVYYPDWPKDSPALAPGSLIRLQITDSVGQSHTTETFSLSGRPQN